MSDRVFAAVDLGASSGRVMAGVVGPERVELHEVHRFPNAAREIDGHLRWDLDGLYGAVLEGLARLAHEFPTVESIGIDTWGVDYGLLGPDGELLAQPIAYRDPRTSSVIDAVHARISPSALYAINGLQFLPFTTLYQLEAEKECGRWAQTSQVVLLPDLIAYWLTGNLRTEATNASTTGLVDITSGQWSTDLLDRLEIPSDRLPPIEQPGEIRGLLRSEVASRLDLVRGTVVTTVGSHDTASAVAAIPAIGESFAYVASGTWSLVGVENRTPILSQASRAANFTNERGVDGRIRFLRNVGGLWLLQECARSWAETGDPADLERLLEQAGALPAGGPRIDVEDPDLVAPDNMPERIAARVAAGGRAAPSTRPQLVRCIIDSLAEAYGSTIHQATDLTGRAVDVIHVVGGGSRNDLLCQLTADLAQLPVIAGPSEATALGNVMIQARAHGAAPASLDELRAVIARHAGTRRLEPRPAERGERP